MSKKVFIIHGWDGYPEEGWFPWLKKELEARGFEVFVPAMPNPSRPVIEEWVDALSKVAGTPDKDSYFIGHSIGCQTILRYLDAHRFDPLETVGGAIFVAGWFLLSNLETEEEKIIGKPWIETPINFEKIKTVCPNITAIFSADDPLVPLEQNVKIFKEQLNAKIIIEKDKGHYSGSDNVIQAPEILSEILSL